MQRHSNINAVQYLDNHQCECSARDVAIVFKNSYFIFKICPSDPTSFKTMLYVQCNNKKCELTAASKPYPLMAKDISFALAELSSIISLNLVTKNCDRKKMALDKQQYTIWQLIFKATNVSRQTKNLEHCSFPFSLFCFGNQHFRYLKIKKNLYL